jgi:ATP-dependent Clp protease ATP-binding subunit ClpA
MLSEVPLQVLLGEAGVGKTAVAEGLAQRIVANDVPTNLQVSHQPAEASSDM